MKKYLVVLSFLIGFNSLGQLANGSTAPNFTLTDWNGNTHTLYDYLNEGKTVFVEVFAAHCPSCWAYHQTNILKNIYNNYGPGGTDEIMVLALEHDAYNGEMAFTGIGDPWNTAGNWLDGTPYPQFNVEGSDRSVFTDYNVTYYPVIYKICPDKKTEMVFASTQETELYDKVQACQIASIPNNEVEWSVFYNSTSKQLNILTNQTISRLQIINMQGQLVKQDNGVVSSTVDLSDLEKGIYLIQFKTALGFRSEKVVIF